MSLAVVAQSGDLSTRCARDLLQTHPPTSAGNLEPVHSYRLVNPMEVVFAGRQEDVLDRREFLRLTGFGMGVMTVPVLGRPVPLLGATTPIATGDKKALADVALNTARMKGASYADVRIGRYLNQFIITREDKVQNIVNTESYGVGVRVIANGTWGFGATSDVTDDGIKTATEKAVAIAKANARFQDDPVHRDFLKESTRLDGDAIRQPPSLDQRSRIPDNVRQVEQHTACLRMPRENCGEQIARRAADIHDGLEVGEVVGRGNRRRLGAVETDHGLAEI